MALLTIGLDGHVASIFPGNISKCHNGFAPLAIPVWSAPKPCSERISMSLDCLAMTRNLVLLAVGAEKQQALHRLAQGLSQPATHLATFASMEVWADVAAVGSEIGQGITKLNTVSHENVESPD
jgi:6-phosphogluconolactonase/glucosamine-6-phosphate isomerase/deaminase